MKIIMQVTVLMHQCPKNKEITLFVGGKPGAGCSSPPDWISYPQIQYSHPVLNNRDKDIGIRGKHKAGTRLQYPLSLY